MVKDEVKKIRDNNGLPVVALRNSNGARATIYQHGAHVASWTTPESRDVLFMSGRSVFRPGVPIRGGVPLVFPQFSDNGSLPKHGFARVREWDVLRTGGDAGHGECSCVLGFKSDSETKAIWPFDFSMELGVRLGEGLALSVVVKNTGAAVFDFSFAFHTYFSVSDIANTSVSGLQGVSYSDSLLNGREDVESREAVTFESEVDRIYFDAPDRLELSDGVARTEITKRNMRDSVVWNPWIEKAARLEDFGDDEYKRMVCVETGNIKSRVQLEPGKEWEGETRFEARGI